MRVFQLSLLLTACTPSPEVQAILDLDGDATAGAPLFGEHCASCHGESGEGAAAGAIDHPHSDAATIRTILEGNGTMPAFRDTLGDQDIADINEHVQTAIFR